MGFDVDLDSREGGPPASGELCVFDPTGSAETGAALRAFGVEARIEQLGSALMAAAKEGRLAGVIVAHDADEELRELFMRAFRSRHPSLPVAYLSTETANDAQQVRFRDEGATAVFSWPLPSADELVPVLTTLFPAAMAKLKPTEAGFAAPAPVMELPMEALSPVEPAIKTEATAVPEHLLEAEAGLARVPDNEASVLRRKLTDLEQHAKEPAVIPVDAFEKAVKEVAQKSAENTELRSELTLIRDRNVLLEERLRRLREEISQLTSERDQLMHDEPSVPKPAFTELRGGVESYTHAMGSAIEFLEDLQHRVGNRAPSLDAHIRTMKLVRQLLHRLASEARGGDGES